MAARIALASPMILEDPWLHDALVRVQRQVDAVMRAWSEAIAADDGLGLAVNEPCSDPVIVLVAAGVGDRTASGVHSAAVAVAMVELACRYHSHVRQALDMAGTRRHNEMVILAGDVLLARALGRAAWLGEPSVSTLMRGLAGSQEAALQAGRSAALGDGSRRQLASHRVAARFESAAALGCLHAGVGDPVGAVVRRLAREVAALTANDVTAAPQGAPSDELAGHRAAASRLVARLPAGRGADQWAALVAHAGSSSYPTATAAAAATAPTDR